MITFRTRSRIIQYAATITCSLNIFTSGLHNGWPSTALRKLLHGNSPIPTTDDEGSWIAASLLFGTLCGAGLAGIILDKIGRKNIILLSAVQFFICWMILAYAHSVPVIILARFLAGIPDGLTFCSVPVYITEIAEPKIRGFLGSSVLVWATMGVLTMNLVGSFLSIKTSALLASTIPIVLLLTFVWMPDSPYYLLMKGKVEKARQSLQMLRGTEDVEEELTRMKNAVEEQNANTGKFLDLFTDKTNRKALYIMMGTRAANQLSGVTAIMFYAQTIFNEFSNSISPVISSTIYFSMQAIFALISSLAVDKVGRRPLMIISLIGIIVALLAESCYFVVKNTLDVDMSHLTLVPIVALILFIVMFNVGMQTIPILLIGEIFATNVKAFAFTINDFYYCVVNIILSKLFQYTKDNFGLQLPFFLFALFSFLGLLFIIFYVPETKGKTLEEIQDSFKGKPVNKEAQALEMVHQK